MATVVLALQMAGIARGAPASNWIAARPVRLPIPDSTGGQVTGVRMTMTADGSAFLAWQRDRPSGGTVEALRVSPRGKPGRPQVLSLAGRRGYLDGLVADSTGGVTVVWSDGPAEGSGGWSVQAARLSRTGRRGPPIAILDGYAHAPRPRIALRDDGAIDLVWSGSALGIAIGTEIPGAPKDFDAAVGIATLLPDDTVAAPRWIWSPAQDGIKEYTSCVSQNSGLVAIARAPQAPGAIAWVLGGEFGHPDRVYVARLDSSSNVTQPVAVSEVPTLLEACEEPILSEDAAGTAFVGWQHRVDYDEEASGADAIQVQSMSATGTVGPPRSFTAPAGRTLGNALWLGPDALGRMALAYAAFPAHRPVVSSMDILLSPAAGARPPGNSPLLPEGRGTDQSRVAFVGAPAPQTLAVWGDRDGSLDLAPIGRAEQLGKTRVLSRRTYVPSEVRAAIAPTGRLAVFWSEADARDRASYWLLEAHRSTIEKPRLSYLRLSGHDLAVRINTRARLSIRVAGCSRPHTARRPRCATWKHAKRLVERPGRVTVGLPRLPRPGRYRISVVATNQLGTDKLFRTVRLA